MGLNPVGVTRNPVRTHSDGVFHYNHTTEFRGCNFTEFHRLAPPPPKSREKILALLKQDPYFTTRKLAEAIGITPKAIEKQLAKLKAEGPPRTRLLP